MSIKINYFKIDPIDLVELEVIFDEKFFSETRFKNRSFRSEKSRQVFNRKVVDLTLKYLNQVFFRHTEKDIKMIAYKHLSYESSLPIKPYTSFHTDDLALGSCVNTIIFYLRKNVKGCGLNIWIESTKTTIPIEQGFAIAFRGDLFHCVEPGQGPGIRDCIIVHVSREPDRKATFVEKIRYYFDVGYN
jgi:hypothetical protein